VGAELIEKEAVMDRSGRNVRVLGIVSLGLLALAAGFVVAGGSVAPVPVWTDEGDMSGARYGWCVGAAGDVNDDGFMDIAVGATRYANSLGGQGKVFIYYGSASGPSVVPDWTEEIGQPDIRFGMHVGHAGDVNGDTYADFYCSARGYSNGQAQEGAAFVYHGGPGGLPDNPSWTGESNQPDAWVTSVASAGDVNGDGYDDLIVGSAFYDIGHIDAGRVFVYYGSALGLSATPDWMTSGDAEEAQYGYCVAGAGDINNDGYDDVIIGARGPHEAAPEGRAFVFHGGASGLSTTADWVAEADQEDTSFGGKVAGAGDVNGDNYDDVIIGATGYDNGETNEGRAFVYHGGPSGLSATPDWTGESDQEDGAFGARVAGAGDIDGDGYDDVLVSANYYDYDQIDEGRVYVFFGSPSGLETAPGWSVDGDQNGCWMGVGLAGVGDQIPGDNLEVMVGAPIFDSGEPDEGKAFIYEAERTSPPPTLVPEPTISSIVDHPQDQGKQVILSWEKSDYDIPERREIVHYSVWRRYLGGGAAAQQASGDLSESPAKGKPAELARYMVSSGWEYVADQDARFLDEYAMTVPTYADSTEAGIPYTAYIVMAHTYSYWKFYVSDPDSGYSVDNIPPECPAQLAGEYLEGTGVRLYWEANVDPDISHYAVYGSETPEFDACGDNLLGTTDEEFFVDRAGGADARHYKVSAYDKNGNEGPAALITADEIKNGPWEGRSYSNLLYQNVPNPFLAATDIAFTTGVAGHVRLVIYDAAGRRVRVLIDGHRPASQYVEVWDGRDDTGRPVASGMYFYLLEAPGWTGGKKMTLAR
jgi:hypothetical protein